MTVIVYFAILVVMLARPTTLATGSADRPRSTIVWFRIGI